MIHSMRDPGNGKWKGCILLSILLIPSESAEAPTPLYQGLTRCRLKPLGVGMKWTLGIGSTQSAATGVDGPRGRL